MANEQQVLDRETIENLVRRHLDPHQPQDYSLNVVGTRRDGDYFYVVVRPDREDIRSYDYYNILANVENELELQEHVNVLLVPAFPGD